MLHTALALAARGLAVFPCRPRDKRPATAHGLKDATTDTATIEQWWHHGPDLNIGIATGEASGIFVIDIDGLDAEAELRKLEREYGALPVSVEAITARGRHIYFKLPDRLVKNSAGLIAPGIDIRGTAGYVLSPPSIHPSGRRYEWSVDSANAFADAPAWLLDKIAAPRNGNGRTLPSAWRTLVIDGAAEGRRDDTITRLTGYLLRRHVDPIVAHQLVHSFNVTHCQPPLPAADIDRIVNSIAGRELRRRGQP